MKVPTLKRPTARVTILVLLIGVLLIVRAVAVKPLPPPGTHGNTIHEKVSETPVNVSTYVYHGLPGEPKSINMPSIGASGFITKMGLLSNGQMQAPANIYTAGFYKNAALPGTPGLSIIEGHVDGPTKPGIFAKLASLKAGDTFTVTRGDNVVLNYTVTSVHQYPEASAINYLFSQDPSVKSQLNLITCGGVFDRSAKEYQQRVIVTASLSS